jgi:hypothetical protein
MYSTVTTEEDGSTTGPTTCKVCVAGNQTNSAQTGCEKCGSGKTSIVGGVCEECLAGYYQSSESCLICASGKFSSKGATTCTLCDNGKSSQQVRKEELTPKTRSAFDVALLILITSSMRAGERILHQLFGWNIFDRRGELQELRIWKVQSGTGDQLRGLPGRSSIRHRCVLLRGLRCWKVRERGGKFV